MVKLVSLVADLGHQVLAGNMYAVDPTDSKARPLHRAAQRGLETFVASLLATGSDPNARDSRSNIPVHWAAQAGQAPCIERLVAAGADPNGANAQLATPLHTAAEHGHAAAIDALVAAGAAVEARDCCGRTPLWAAASAGHSAAVSALLAVGADTTARDSEHNSSVLQAASTGGHAAVVKELLAADPESMNNSTLSQASEWSPQGKPLAALLARYVAHQVCFQAVGVRVAHSLAGQDAVMCFRSCRRRP